MVHSIFTSPLRHTLLDTLLRTYKYVRPRTKEIIVYKFTSHPSNLKTQPLSSSMLSSSWITSHRLLRGMWSLFQCQINFKKKKPPCRIANYFRVFYVGQVRGTLVYDTSLSLCSSPTLVFTLPSYTNNSLSLSLVDSNIKSTSKNK